MDKNKILGIGLLIAAGAAAYMFLKSRSPAPATDSAGNGLVSQPLGSAVTAVSSPTVIVTPPAVTSIVDSFKTYTYAPSTVYAPYSAPVNVVSSVPAMPTPTVNDNFTKGLHFQKQDLPMGAVGSIGFKEMK